MDQPSRARVGSIFTKLLIGMKSRLILVHGNRLLHPKPSMLSHMKMLMWFLRQQRLYRFFGDTWLTIIFLTDWRYFVSNCLQCVSFQFDTNVTTTWVAVCLSVISLPIPFTHVRVAILGVSVPSPSWNITVNDVSGSCQSIIKIRFK